MSLILEALKKSEQQRRLGEVPSFGTPAPLTRRRRSLLPLLVVLILVALGVGWWFSRAPQAPVASTAATRPAPPPTTAPAATPAPAASAPRPANATANLKPVQPRPATPAANAPVAAPVLPMPTTDRPGTVGPTVSMPVASGAGQPHAAAPKDEPETGPLLPKPASNATAAAPAAAKPVASANAPTATAPATAPANTATKPAAPAVATATPAAPAAPRARARPAAPALPLVWELPYSTRKDLPELSLTMHLYSDVAKERFVVLQGERHVEGDELGNGVVLREITADGMVLDFKGQRFVFPRDGR